MDLKLQGKRALVTGASRGLGYATARGLAGEGAAIALNSRDAAKLTKAAGDLAAETGAPVTAIPGDISTPDLAGQIISAAVAALGGLDLLVTNAGGPPPGKFETFDEATWQAAVELSFMSHVRLIRAALPHLRQSSTPAVLTITSFTVRQPLANLILSNSVRAATVALTKSLALELGSEGIRFNSILPGWTETERVEQLLANRAKTNNTSVEVERKKITGEIALGRMAQPEEFANVAVFLLSPAASYLTGTILSVDGGVVKGLF